MKTWGLGRGPPVDQQTVMIVGDSSFYGLEAFDEYLCFYVKICATHVLYEQNHCPSDVCAGDNDRGLDEVLDTSFFTSNENGMRNCTTIWQVFLMYLSNVENIIQKHLTVDILSALGTEMDKQCDQMGWSSFCWKPKELNIGFSWEIL